ncbi:MAG: DUF1638 domain-containing protein [Pseudomonadales bacterium]
MLDSSPNVEPAPILVIACGALSHEIQYLKILNGWNHIRLQCLDADLHNTPKQIPAILRDMIHRYRDEYNNIFVAYADCGTGGAIDRLLEEEGIERLPGAHCYSFYVGEQRFNQLANEEPGTFYLTDFLAKHFDRLIIKGLKLHLYPQLRDDFFGNYRRVVYLSQRQENSLIEAAREAADFLQLEFEHLPCGYGDLETGLKAQVIAFG